MGGSPGGIRLGGFVKGVGRCSTAASGVRCGEPLCAVHPHAQARVLTASVQYVEIGSWGIGICVLAVGA